MIDVAIPLFLVVCGIAVLLVKDLMSSIMIFSVYSLLIAIEWVRLNAIDVAITEAAVGAGISTVLFMIILSRTKSVEECKKSISIPALLVAVGVAGVLLYGTVDLPNLRDPNIAPSTHVSPYYLENAYKQTGQENAVAAILASYRGYDTLGETTVVATAAFCLILLLRGRRHTNKDLKKYEVTGINKCTVKGVGIKPTKTNPPGSEQDKDIIKKTVTKFLMPFIQLFGLYVIVHGELGPGGGFQGGVVLGVSIIVYSLVFGFKEAQQRMSVKAKDLLVSSGVLLYGGIGVLALFLGGNYLQYNVLLPDPKFASIIGILGIEIGVGITVAAVMITLFYETVRIDANG
ncbi:DUF4040 domain-containing protein [Desulfosporosinus sp.]|uniref:DUF4040 domain-containing protein n=1 Tax=Desulfosporosinus sp. TaxID=157907 RepID=UPI0025BCC32C|nr:DUF4040 domain-containing protein [Desulfosporosinus sp.]MBC2721955.1 DUF4040 domain-containing protein [Desulfosporosinus sp.]MBC2728440.1 DUF4040 domain-containing protein [Desulfosporosinus sp.]